MMEETLARIADALEKQNEKLDGIAAAMKELDSDMGDMEDYFVSMKKSLENLVVITSTF